MTFGYTLDIEGTVGQTTGEIEMNQEETKAHLETKSTRELFGIIRSTEMSLNTMKALYVIEEGDEAVKRHDDVIACANRIIRNRQ